MESCRMSLCRLKAFSLLCDHMYNNSISHTLRFLEHTKHRRDIMPIHRSKIGNPHVLKKHSRNHKLLKATLRFTDTLNDPVTPWYILQSIIHTLFDIQIGIRCTDIIQILGNAAYIF